MDDLLQFTPPKDLPEDVRQIIFQHIQRRLAAHRHAAELYATAEYSLSTYSEADKIKRRDEFIQEIDIWSQSLLEQAWIACQEPGGGKCPAIDPLSDSSVADLPRLPPQEILTRILNAILFLHLTSSKSYSSRTRSFLSSFGPLDEAIITKTLKNPDSALKEAEKQVKASKNEHAKRGKALRMVGMGLGAVAGGVLVGVTGGLAAPLVGAAVGTVFSILGVSGTAIGLLATGLASSSVVCGALFGVYGAKTTADMVARHTKEIQDLAIVPVRPPRDTLALRLCVSGWLSSHEDVTAPWLIFNGNDTFALQWEVDALRKLSDALSVLIKSNAMRYIKARIISSTVFAGLMFSLAPMVLLKIGNIIDNPWMNAKALAVKAGAVLADLLHSRAFGNRPVTLTGYSLGSLVIFEALKRLSELPAGDTAHLVEDVFLFGTPVPAEPRTWSAVRRVVAGRLINGYGSEDYVLAVLSRASDASWAVAGLHPVDVQGVESIAFVDIDGHLKWRGMVGRCLEVCNAPDVDASEVAKQLDIVKEIGDFMDMRQEEVEQVLEAGPMGRD